MPKAELFKNRSVYEQAKDQNYEGAPTFTRSLEERLLQVLTTGNFENTFYADAKKLADEAVAVFKEALAKDPRFLAQAIVFARTEGLMRIAPITALVVLTTGDKNAKQYAKNIFAKVVQTPGDLQDFVSLVRTGHFRGNGRLVKELVGRWLENISEYHAIKYGSEKQDFSLRDIYRLSRPKLNGWANEIARYIVKGTIEDAEAVPVLDGYERFLKSKDLELVEKFKLPYEVVSGQVASKEAWELLAKNAPFMNMLRNLNNYAKYGVLDGDIENLIANRLSDPEQVKKSKQFPFRFLSAHKAFRGTSSKVKEALYTAIEHSFQNMPDIAGKTLVAVDQSGSMNSRVSDKSELTCEEIGNIFGAALFKKAEDATLLAFSSDAREFRASRRDTLMTIVRAFTGFHPGGTSLSAPIEWALDERRHFDTMVLFTDNESWADHLHKGYGATDILGRYRKVVNPDVRVYLVTLLPYAHKALMKEPNVYEIFGWSDAVVNYIGAVENLGNTQIDKVKQIAV